MKHKPSVTFILVMVFLLTQIIGLSLIQSISDETRIDKDGRISIEADDSTENLTPETEGFGSLIYIIVAVGLGTAALLLIVRFNKVNVWKAWFFFAVTVAVGISFKVILSSLISKHPFLSVLPWIIGAGLALLKMYRQNIFVYNLTEVFMYSGIALILAPIFNVFWAGVLLIIISVYDMVAVWKSKHMIKMAKFQSDSRLFAGLMIPYGKGARKKPSSESASKKSGKKVRTAILGGGDVVFPLIFGGALLRALILEGVMPGMALFYSFIVSAGATLAITALFLLAKKDRFYPAMPFVSAGCFLGWFVASSLAGSFGL